MSNLIDYLIGNSILLGFLIFFSIVSFFFTLAAVPIIIIRLPSNYFTHQQRTPLIFINRHPLVFGLLILGKNLLGLVFIFMGILMLVLPGQGILTIVMGIFLLNFPGKYQLEKWIINQKWVLNSMNWLREKAGKDPLNI